MLGNNNIHADGATGRSGKDYNDYINIIQWVTCIVPIYVCVCVCVGTPYYTLVCECARREETIWRDSNRREN